MTPGQNVPNAEKSGSNHKLARQLTSQQRAKLKGMAHALKPVVQVGSAGITPNMAEELKRNLMAHELIKVQIPGQTDSASKEAATEALTAALPPHTHVVDRIGRMVILYLEKAPGENPKIPFSSL